MNAPMTHETIHTTNNGARGRHVAGIALIGIGLLVFAAQFVNAELLFLPLLGLIFLAWGIAVRHVGFIIPGGIVSSIGVATMLLEGPAQGLSDNAEGGIFFLCFAAGWLLIAMLGEYWTRQTARWALIPSGIMALLATGLLVGGTALQMLSAVGRVFGMWWPLGLIGLGAYLFAQRNQDQV